MQLREIAIHKIQKEPNENTAILHLSDEPLPINDEIVIDFANALSRAYYHKKSRFYTQFQTDEIEPQFKTYLDRYINGEIQYLPFSRQVTQLLKNEMEKKPQSRGGIFVTMRYISTNNNEYLFLALLNNKQEFSINDTLELIKQITLNIEQMAMASVVNLSKYRDSENNYITFLRGLRDIPDYFIDFVGADSNRNRQVAQITKDWVKAINDFFESQHYSQEIIEEKTNALLRQVKTLHKNHEIITAEVIANTLYPENPDEFISFIYNEHDSYELPSEIERMDTTVISSIKMVSYTSREKNFSIKFRKADIDNIVTIEDNSIIITDQEIIDEIRRKIENEE